MLVLSRRSALAGLLLTAAPIGSLHAQRQSLSPGEATERLAMLERTAGGRLGVSILNLSSGNRAGHRADERFLLLSTFKALLAALVLSRVDSKAERLDRRIVFSKQDLVAWSPVAEKRTGQPGMTLAELCEATVTLSDNAAANLLLDSFGGPATLTAYLRSLGDAVTRLDRIEPALNEHDGPGDVRDTTSPGAMLDTLRALLFGDALSSSSRAQFAAWLIANKTGDRRLRAGFPAGWRVGDKTGTNGSGGAHDVGVAWPPAGGAVLVTAYYTQPSGSAAQRDAILAETARIAAQL